MFSWRRIPNNLRSRTTRCNSEFPWCMCPPSQCSHIDTMYRFRYNLHFAVWDILAAWGRSQTQIAWIATEAIAGRVLGLAVQDVIRHTDVGVNGNYLTAYTISTESCCIIVNIAIRHFFNTLTVRVICDFDLSGLTCMAFSRGEMVFTIRRFSYAHLVVFNHKFTLTLKFLIVTRPVIKSFVIFRYSGTIFFVPWVVRFSFPPFDLIRVTTVFPFPCSNSSARLVKSNPNMY